MIDPATDLLFRPLDFGRARLRNRIVMAPMTRQRAPDGAPGPVNAAYYRRRAAGGAAMIMSEGTYIDHPAAAAQAQVPHFFGAAALKGWSAVLQAVHDEGAAMVPQLWHVGAIRRAAMGPDTSIIGVGPAAIVEGGAAVVAALNERDIAEIVASYARGARWARELGFDGVAVHGAHGYLLDQFLWGVTNDRADRYGGTLDNRCRFAVEVVSAMRAAVGPDFPIVFRFSQWKMNDYDARIASDPDELAVILGLLARAGVDCFDVSTRRFWLPAFEGSARSLAAWTKALTGRLVMAVGSVGLDQPHQSKVYRRPDNVDAKVTDVAPVAAALARGDFDLVAVGRAMLADASWASKVRDGAYDRIAPFTHAALATYA